MELKPVFEKINFVNRYQEICEEYNDFDKRMSNSKKTLQESVMKKMGYDYKYISNGSFFQVKEETNNWETQFNLVLKKGIVESLFYIYNNKGFDDQLGRLDFIPEKIGIPFDRKKYNLVFYKTEKDLEEILKSLFSIYEDLKIALVEHLESV